MSVIGRGGFYHAGQGGESGKRKLKKRKANWDTMKNTRDMKGKQKWGKQTDTKQKWGKQKAEICFPIFEFYLPLSKFQLFAFHISHFVFSVSASCSS
jgi:hypothetical protein